MKNICVFCGANSGSSPEILEHTQLLAEALAARKNTLVYGGGRVGLMGILADGVLRNGGQVIGVIPKKLADLEVAHTGLTELHLVDSMASRKDKMMEQADAFIALPGGLGTLDELFEALTCAQLNLHKKPVGIINTNGFYDQLLAFLDHACAQGLLAKVNRDRLIVANTPSELLDKLTSTLEVTES